jgi:hypothetical protein
LINKANAGKIEEYRPTIEFYGSSEEESREKVRMRLKEMNEMLTQKRFDRLDKLNEQAIIECLNVSLLCHPTIGYKAILEISNYLSIIM